jgi:hypothetical protein
LVVASRTPYQPCFAVEAAEFLAQLPKARQRRVLRLAQTLAANPFVLSDYAVTDESGREQEHLLIDDFVFTYWLDHSAREVRITEIEDAS